MRRSRGPTPPPALRRRAPRVLLVAELAAALFGWADVAPAQVFRIEAGSSSLYRADGGSIHIQARTWDGWFGLGALDPVRVGGAVRTRIRNVDVALGDDVVLLRLPTDFFDSGQLLFTRGAGIGVARGATKLRVRGGSTSTVYSAPYFTVAASGEAIGMVELETTLGRSLTLSVRDLIAREPTHILGLGWNSGALRAAASLGAGAGEPYGAVGFAYDREWVSVKAAYIHTQDGFRRARIEQSQGSECDRENVQVTWRPLRGVSLTAGRNHYVQPASGGRRMVRGSVDQLLASGTFGGTTARGAYFASRSPEGGGTGSSFTLGRDLSHRLRLESGVQRSDPRHGPPSTSLLGTLRENLTSRLQAVQVVTRTGRRTTVSFGGSFLSNPLTVGMEYQTLFLPFARQTSFEQALMLTVRLQPWGSLQANVASYVGPDGRVRYTAYGNDYLYRGEDAPQPRAVFTANIVRGRVLSEGGSPFPGAALRIGGTLVFTDSRGMFFVRLPKPGIYPLEVAFDEFLSSGVFEVVGAPAAVRTAGETDAEEVVVRIRSVRSVVFVTPPPLPRAQAIEQPRMGQDAPGTRVESVPNAVHFALDSAELSAATRMILDSLARSLRGASEVRLRLAGHCDRRGSEAYNFGLSRLRAEAVRAYLVGAGVGAERIDVAYHGKLFASSEVTDPAILAQGRCVTFWYDSPKGVKLVIDRDERDIQVEADTP